MSRRIARNLKDLKIPKEEFQNSELKSKWDYSHFDRVDGRHPWQEAVPEGYLLYPVRMLERGQILWFNFNLAREMGLLHSKHPDVMTPELDKKIIETFSIQIINEWDQTFGGPIPARTLKKNKYMATRYLQLQHTDKTGRTSGDGRGIWNGTIEHGGQVWDISSRGTGVTALAPGSVEANRPLKTGCEDFGYGCGLADTTEILGSALFSEILHNSGIKTERVLAVIDLGRGVGIGVRAATNLIRPAHLFLYLKQNRWSELKSAVDYLLQRQLQNKRLKTTLNSPVRYRNLALNFAGDFAEFAAQLERNYIFAWLDWDGDNVLAEAGIIDYGSIRQFGLRHDQYRYDDVDRYSTNLNEQRAKARLTVQVFAQMTTFLETKKKLPLARFRNSIFCKEFDRIFEQKLKDIFVLQCGFSAESIALLKQPNLLKKYNLLKEKLYQSFSVLERTKSRSGVKALPDGINKPAIYNMRRVLRELPRYLQFSPQKNGNTKTARCTLEIEIEQMIQLMHSGFAKKSELRPDRTLRSKIQRFTKDYLALYQFAAIHADFDLAGFSANAKTMNREGRMTGNGSEYIVEEILKARRRGMSLSHIRSAMAAFILYQSQHQTLNAASTETAFKKNHVLLDHESSRLLNSLINLALEHEEDI